MAVIYAFLGFALIYLGFAIIDPDKERKKECVVLAGWIMIIALSIYGLTLPVSGEVFLGLYAVSILAMIMAGIKCYKYGKLIPPRPMAKVNG
ncbi:MAG: hypothetical protein A2Y82_04135 [Candidatus Buchananbacteria bacterium RBG_13_36_9]|uniref:Uncharacterized protein n=1 Tax=Candidatus Buchananbacteria bacterium RBG_13_36_9 TaxID=1797530 RepID=A0A1G1XR38_9BACT|nr:MAG: hypothetical protein A2Y82_04135 [Candidatus Buchananbacteria bacterium RBG_13_36_9]